MSSKVLHCLYCNSIIDTYNKYCPSCGAENTYYSEEAARSHEKEVNKEVRKHNLTTMLPIVLFALIICIGCVAPWIIIFLAAR